MSFSPSRRFQLLSLALGVTVALAMVPSAAQASVKNPTTKSVLKATQKAMSTVTGVHIYVYSKTGKDSSVVIVDIGSTYGQESIVSGKEHVKITVTPTDAYLSGSSTGLTTIMGLTAAQVKKVGTRSIVMKSGTSPYTSFQGNLTTGVLSSILPAAKGTKFKFGGGKNSKDYQLSWKTAASQTASATTDVLTVSSGSLTLPVKEVITGSTGGGTTTFSHWNERVTEPTPPAADTIPYASVVGTKAG
jgi:hypothetical protein